MNTTDLALNQYRAGIQQCKSKEEISEFCQMLCTLGSKTIHGIEGRKFKKDFLGAAIKDNEMITPELVN